MKKVFTYNQVNVSYRVEGKGIVVVLLHGFGETGTVWDAQIEYLKKYCKLIVPDLPGSGLSVIPDILINNSEFSTIEYYASCIHALLIHEQVNACIMLGHSMGGYITLAFADKFSALLKGFGFVHSTAFADSPEKKINRQRGIELMEKYGGYSFLKTTTPNLFTTSYKEAEFYKVENLIEEGRFFATPALQNYYRAMMNRPDRIAVLKGSKFPVLFIIGEEDVAVPIKDSLTQASIPKISYIHILQDVGHMGMWEKESLVNDFIEKYISALQLV
ncbi:alpha/beta fold hydrolase [Chitinophagaceae bacterium LWZ2-11]